MSWPKFPTPKSSLVADVIQSPSGGKPVTKDELINKTVNGHPLNQFLQLVVPTKVPSTRGHNKKAIEDLKMKLSMKLPLLSMMLNGSLPPTANESLSFFKLTNVPLHLLYHKIFIESYVKKGVLYCTSINCDVVRDDCLAIIPSGNLILGLTTKSYQILGLEGKPSKLIKKNVLDKKIVEIDLKSNLSSNFDSKYYKRNFKCMRNSGLKFDILIRWQPDGKQDISCESIGNYFEFMKRNPEKENEEVDGGSLTDQQASLITISPCLPTIRSFSNACQLVPSTIIDFFVDLNASGDRTSDITEHDLEQLVDDTIDFVGASLCSIKTKLDGDKLHINSFGFDDRYNKFESSQVICSETCGLIPTEFVTELLDEIQESGLLEEIPFIAIIVSGFENSVISYIGKRNENGRDLSGENIYGLLLATKPVTEDSGSDQSESGERSEKRIKLEEESKRIPNKCLLWRQSDSYDYSIEQL